MESSQLTPELARTPRRDSVFGFLLNGAGVQHECERSHALDSLRTTDWRVEPGP